MLSGGEIVGSAQGEAALVLREDRGCRCLCDVGVVAHAWCAGAGCAAASLLEAHKAKPLRCGATTAAAVAEYAWVAWADVRGRLSGGELAGGA